jgi:hypothetical protein
MDWLLVVLFPKSVVIIRIYFVFLYVILNTMGKKLTLSLDQAIIAKAKEYAKTHNTSLSKLIESYLGTLTNRPSEEEDITPLVESLSGVIDLPAGFDEKQGYSDYLSAKYK